MLKNFKKGFPGDYEVKLTPGKLHTLCKLEWPTFGAGWFLEGTFDLSTVRTLYWVVTGTLEHPDQFSYLDSWMQIVTVVPRLGLVLCK